MKAARGFTLIEIIVSIAILATLIAGVLLAVNPQKQLNKSKDALRREDLQSIKTALDAYYHDNDCYPTTVPFGAEWSAGTGSDKAIYMKKVPQDPSCNTSTGANCYQYKTDTNTCPQWNVVFAKLSDASTLAQACPLSSLSNCTPAGYTNATYACTMSGSVNCSGLAAASLADIPPPVYAPEATQAPSASTATPVVPTPTASQSGGTPTSAPTPTPTTNPTSQSFTVAMNSDPWFDTGTVAPYDSTAGGTQSVSISTHGHNSPVESVTATVHGTFGTTTYPMTLSSGTTADGVWTGSWPIPAHANFSMELIFTATNSQGTGATTAIIVP